MSDRKLQSKYVPLRVRFRSSVEQVQRTREDASNANGKGPGAEQMSNMTNVSESVTESQRRAQQIKELLRLGNLLRAELGLDEVLQQMVSSTSVCTGFRVAVISLIDEKAQHWQQVAFAGVSEDDQRILRNAHDSVEAVSKLMVPEFRISQSYFISHEHAEAYAGITVVAGNIANTYEPGGWHPDDLLLIPIYSPRGQKLLGMLSLDDPEDGKAPTEESIEVAELFANQAAIAIDTALLFQEREAERVALEVGIEHLREDLDQVRRGDLRMRVRSTHAKLQPAVEVINAFIEEIGTILGSMQMVTQAVDEHARSVQRNSEMLVFDTGRQEQQVQQISAVVNEIATMMSSISERAAMLSKTAVEAMDVTIEAQGTVDRAVDGMGMVRDATMQSARTMKSLSESGQEINETVLAITDLTIRMHHLALNAAIEATRAGENGQGFAVVAQEIRTLAVLGSEAARKVATYIRTIQHEMTAVSQSVEQNTQHVVMQTERVTQTGVALEAICVSTEQLANLVQDICTSADNQTQGSQLVVSSVKDILRMTEGITLHTQGMQQSLEHLIGLTNSLRSRMALFRMNER